MPASLSTPFRAAFPAKLCGASVQTVARRAVSFLLALAIGLASGPAACAATDVTALLAAGDTALAKLDLDAATAAYRQAYRSAPQRYEAAWKLARATVDRATLSTVAVEQERLCHTADTLARAAIALNPDGAKGHVYLAIALGKLALFEGGKRKVRLSHAIKVEADSALALDPDEDLAHHVLGVWNREVVELPGLLKFFANTFYGRLPQASLDSALVHLKRAAALRPDVVPHHVELGITLAAAKRYPEAAAELESALRLPTGWVTDDFYRAKARKALADVRRHLK
jgi:tetratricopeptide (TPR) repeat protein